MRSPRYRLRTLMLAAAVVAIFVGAESMWRRSAIYRARASYFAEWERERLRLADETDELATEVRTVAAEDRERGDDVSWRLRLETVCCLARVSADDRLAANYFAGLKRKYEYAASHPWLPVAPDPPEPDMDP
jgi:hypothetical protein